MLRCSLLGTLLATTALACTPAPQVGPMHAAPMHRDFEVVEPRADCALLAENFCQDLGESPACEAVRSGTPKLAPSACVEIRAHYADVLADLRKMNQRFEPLSLAVADAIVAPGAPGLGDPSAPIELVVFWDYEDPYCAKAIVALAEVYRRFPGQIRVVVSQYPLAFHPACRPRRRGRAVGSHPGGILALLRGRFRQSVGARALGPVAVRLASQARCGKDRTRARHTRIRSGSRTRNRSR